MTHALFYYAAGVKMDRTQFERMFEHCRQMDPSAHATLPHVKKIYFLADWEQISLLRRPLEEAGYSEEDIDVFMMMFSNAHWRGVSFYEKGIIALNVGEVVDSSDYYCLEHPPMEPEEFLAFIKGDSRFAEITAYRHDPHLVRQLIFWKTLFHEIRHVEQYHYPERMTHEEDEQDADAYGVYMYKELIEPRAFQTLKIAVTSLHVGAMTKSDG